MVEKGIRGGIYQSIYRYAKANNKHIQDNDKNKESSYLQYWNVDKLYGWAICQKPPVNNFEWIKDTSQFKEDFTKNNTEKSDYDIFSKLMLNILKNYMTFIMICHVYQNKWRLKKTKLVANLHDKTEYVIHIRNLKQAVNHELVF